MQSTTAFEMPAVLLYICVYIYINAVRCSSRCYPGYVYSTGKTQNPWQLSGLDTTRKVWSSLRCIA